MSIAPPSAAVADPRLNRPPSVTWTLEEGYDKIGAVRFANVSVESVAHVDAPVRVASADLVARLRPTFDRVGIRPDLLERVAGVRERRYWEEPVAVADGAAEAGRRALAKAGVDPDRVGVLISTSVSRDHIEPSTASVVHGALGLPYTCQNFDLGNACLAFLNGMDVAGRMIEHGEIAYALIVNGEVSNQVTERTVERLSRPEATADQVRAEFASLTLGSGAAAMVLGRADESRESHRYLGSVFRAATRFSHLCRGTMDRMVTDTRGILENGLALAKETYDEARAAFGWDGDVIDEYVLHQVSRVHTDALLALLGIDPARALAIYPEHGNTGPAALPIVLSKLDDAGRLRPGGRIALLGIGSGLNCAMGEIVW
jgi:3-oxoacyl-[acyl-carrier-protein] synthase III